MSEKNFTIKEAANYFKEKTGVSIRTFSRYHRKNINFKIISPRLKIISESDLLKYINQLPTENN